MAGDYAATGRVMSDEEQSFMTAIAADVDNDMLRLIYADWLEERGDHRCEYLRMMCQLMAMPWGRTPQRDQLEAIVDDFHRYGDLEWSLQVARRINVILHTVVEPLHLMDLIAEVRQLTGMGIFNAVDLVRGMPNTGRFRSDPRRVVQATSHQQAQQILARLSSAGARVTLVPATSIQPWTRTAQ